MTHLAYSPRIARTFRPLAALLSLIALLLAAVPALAQSGSFGPRLWVNDRVITQYEVDQRALFLQLLRAPGNPQDEALKALIDDRLRMTMAKRMGLSVTPEALKAGMAEFASRANLTTEQFLVELDKGGVAEPTFRDFVEAGLVWRDVVRAKFGGRVTITEAEIDRAIAAAARQVGLRVLVSELVIPAPPESGGEPMALATRLSTEITTEAAFSAAARKYSASASAGNGGRLDWLPLGNLPPSIAPFVLALEPGQVSRPVSVPNAVVLFQLRGIEEDKSAKPVTVNVDYAQFLIPNAEGSRAEAEALATRLDTCNDLYPLAKGLGEERLLRETKPVGDVPQDVALELAGMDPNETSTAIVRGPWRVLLMLCNRSVAEETPPTRDQIGQKLLSERLNTLAEGYLADLRADAIIREP